MLSNDNGRLHVEERSQAAQKAFYGLQGAGLHFRGVEPQVASRIFSVGVRTILTYSAEAIQISPANMGKLERTQGKLIKSVLGIRKFSTNTPLLRAMNIPPVQKTIGYSCLNLLRSSLLFHSNASHFYSHILTSSHSHSANTLVSRCAPYVNDVDFIKLLICNDYIYKGV